MIYNKLEGTSSQSFKLGKNGVSIANESGQLKVLVPIIGQDAAYEFIIGADELSTNSKDIPSSEAIATYIQDTVGEVLEGNYLDLSVLTEQTVQGPIVFAQDVTVEGELKGPENFVINPVASTENEDETLGTVIIKGNLQIDGQTTTINSSTLTVDDKNIVLASGALDQASADGAGITIDGAGVEITYSAANDSVSINKDLEVDGQLKILETENVPMFIYSTVKVDNLNADMLDGKHLSDIEAERVPRDLSSLSQLQYASALQPEEQGPVFIYADDGTADGRKLSLSDVVRPSSFVESEEIADKVKVGDFIYSEIEN